MVNHDQMTLTQYYGRFLSLLGVLAAAPPLMVAVIVPFLPDSASAYWFPPIGDVGGFARLGLVCLAFIVTFLIYFWQGGKWLLVASAAVSFACFCVYVALYPRLVMRINIPSQQTVVHVIVGYDRTPFAKANFGGYSDEDMLRERGTDNEEIKKLWTYQSLTVARLLLLVSYCGFILGLVAVFSLGIVLTGSKG